MQTDNPDNFPAGSGRAALCVGHPGHELKVYGWLCRNRPLCQVLTDGSGPDRPPRLESTRRTIERAEATPGGIFGRFSDREIYALMRAGDSGPFVALAAGMADEWARAEVTAVVGDMLEGFSTTHDVCRMAIDAAVEFTRRTRGVALENFAFPLEAMVPPDGGSESISLWLDDGEFAAKRTAAGEAYPELSGEVDRLIAAHGEAAFRREAFYPTSGPSGLEWTGSDPPFYESYGRKRMEQGHYDELITWRDHLRPIAHELWRWATGD